MLLADTLKERTGLSDDSIKWRPKRFFIGSLDRVAEYLF